jgi:hypothetical protein
VTDSDAAIVSHAVVLWAGWGTDSWPTRDDQRVIAEYGADLGAQLMAAVRALAHDFYSSDADLTVADLAEMGDQAALEFRARNPDVSEDAVQALTWCYTFDNR